MEKELKTLGLIIRTSDYKENDKIATVLTKDFGRLDVSIRGCKKQGGKAAGSVLSFLLWRLFIIQCRGQAFCKLL